MVAGRLSRVLQRTIPVRCGVAGTGRGRAYAARPRCAARIPGRIAPRAAGGAHRSWCSLALLSALFLLGTAEAQVLSGRIWPARDYTRLTLESSSALKHSVFSVKDPQRLVLDL